jgi:hypothetical protein
MRGLNMAEENTATATPEEATSVVTPEVAPEPKPEADFSAQLAAERKRITAIQAVCGMAKVPQSKVNEFIEGGTDLAAVNLFCASHLSTQNPPVAADADDSTEDPDATLKAEYREHAATVSKMGMTPVSEEAFVKHAKRSA